MADQAVSLFNKVKMSLRISHNALDDAEISPLIDAAKKDLQSAGVVKLDECDPLITRAVIVYCKAHFGYDNPEAERFERVFNSLKNTLSQMKEYTTAGGGGGG